MLRSYTYQNQTVSFFINRSEINFSFTQGTEPFFSQPIPPPVDPETDISHYEVAIVSVADYSPFTSFQSVRTLRLVGVQLDSRTMESQKYRYGFQNQEKDDEVKGAGNRVNYKYRMHSSYRLFGNPRLGRFFAVDPMSTDYPWNSPYAFSENRVIDGVELEGLEVVLANEIWDKTEVFTTVSSTDLFEREWYKVARIHGQLVTLHKITSGPNKGNWLGIAHTGDTPYFEYQNSSKEVPENYGYEYKYVIGKDRVSENWNQGDLGQVSTSSGALASLSSKYEFSLALAKVVFWKANGMGYFSQSTGEWVSTFTDEKFLKKLAVNYAENLIDSKKPSHVTKGKKGSFSGFNDYQKKTKGTYTGPNRMKNAANGYNRFNASDSDIDLPEPAPATTQEIEENKK